VVFSVAKEKGDDENKFGGIMKSIKKNIAETALKSKKQLEKV